MPLWAIVDTKLQQRPCGHEIYIWDKLWTAWNLVGTNGGQWIFRSKSKVSEKANL